MKILVTGAAGFIGMHTSLKLCQQGHDVVGLDNLNDYYDPSLKHARLAQLDGVKGFRFIRGDIADNDLMARLFADEKFDRVVNLAAQAGVRYSLQNPHAYAQANLVGFLNILEGCRHNNVAHLVYASSSSVYGGNTRTPFSEQDAVDHPVSLYAATKKANELMAHTYSHLYGIPTTGLRFFTVYGPWGRPDMAPWLFTSAILEGRPIKVFNHGDMRRDFTYIDDIVQGIVATLERAAEPDATYDSDHPNPATSTAPYRVFNIGNQDPAPLMEFIGAIEDATGKIAEKQFLPMQPGDVPVTSADTRALEAWTGFAPHTPLREGIGRWVEWYRSYIKAD